MAVNDLIQIRKGIASAWTSANPVLSSGEPGYDLTNKIFKIGDGVSNWASLGSINLSSSNITNFNSSVSGLVSGVYAPLSGATFTGPVSATSGVFSSGINITNLGGGIFSMPSTSNNIFFTNTSGNVWFIGDQGGGNNVLAKYIDSSSGPIMQFRKHRGSYSSPLPSVSGDNVGTIQFETLNYDGTIIPQVAKIQVFTEATPASGQTNVPGQIRFYTSTSSNVFNNPTQRMVITSNGLVGINTTTPVSTLDVSGLITSISGNFTQNLQVNGTGVSISGHTHTASQISDSTAVGRTLLTAADAATQRTSLGLGSLATQNGTFSGTSSGTNTGDQTISIGGDVTASGGTGALTATVTKINGVALSGLSTGLLKNTTSTGAPTIAIAGTDYAAASHTHTASQISDSTAVGRTLLTAADAATQRTSLGLGTMSTQSSSSYSLTSHTHTSSSITDFNTAVSGLVNGVYAPLSGATFSGTVIVNSIAGNAASNNVVDGRLTISAGSPIQLEGGNNFSNILYFTPFNGNRISLYDTTNSRWQIHTFSEISISLASGYAANTMYDVFIYDNAGTKTLELTAWTTQGGFASPTATASARSSGSVLALQDGVYVKSGSPNKRYLGTARTNATAGAVSDGPDQRFLWNMYNRVNKYMSVADLTSHTYTTASARIYRNQNTNIVEFISGLDRYTAINMTIVTSTVVSPSASIPVGIGADITNGVNTLAIVNNTNTATLRTGSTDYQTFAGAGYHYLAMVQVQGASGATFSNATLVASITC